MRRRGLSVVVLGLLAFAGVATAGVLAPGGGASTTKAKPVTITVSAKEFSFALSKRTVPVGTTVTFKVVNKGKISHDFKIAGKKTPLLLPGKSAKLTVVFKKKGHFPYVCTVPGHAAAGMKGTFSVGVSAVKPPPVTTTAPSTTTTTQTTTPTGTVGPGNTTVQVGMFEYRFDLSQTTVPSGQVTFVVTNKGQEVHNFDLATIHAGSFLNPGQTETFTVSLPPRNYDYLCDVTFHAQMGMQGTLTVTP